MSQSTPPGMTQGPSSTMLVILSLVLAVIAMVAIQVYASMLRAEHDEQMDTMYIVANSKKKGQTLERDDLREVQVPKRLRENLDKISVIFENELERNLSKPLARDVQVDELYMTRGIYTGTAGDERPQPDEGFGRIALDVKSNRSVRLLPNDYVNIYAYMPNVDKDGNRVGGTSSVLVLERIQVKEVDSRGVTEAESRSVNFSRISVDIPLKDASAMNDLKRYVEDQEGFDVLRVKPTQPRMEKRRSPDSAITEEAAKRFEAMQIKG